MDPCRRRRSPTCTPGSLCAWWEPDKRGSITHLLGGGLDADRTTYRIPAFVLRLGYIGLGVVRSLALHGVPVVALHAGPRRWATTYTRLCRTIEVEQRAKDRGGSPILDAALDLAKRAADRPVLFLTSDRDVVEVSRRRAEVVEAFRVHLPDEGPLEALLDKVAFSRFAEENGLCVPRTFTVERGEGWERVLAECPFPCIVKPKYRTLEWAVRDLKKTYVAHSRDELVSVIDRVADVEGDCVVQEWIPGADSEVVFHLAYHRADGREVASFTGRKVRQWWPHSGATSMAVPLSDHRVAREARRVMELAGLRGLGSVEFKRDPRDGALKITEPTVGRPDTQEELATANGVNLALHAYRDLAGLEPPLHHHRRRRPARWIFLEADFKSMRYYMRRGELSLAEAIRSYRGPRYYADFSWRDPLPFLVRMAKLALRRLEGRLRPQPGK